MKLRRFKYVAKLVAIKISEASPRSLNQSYLINNGYCLQNVEKMGRPNR